MLLISIDSLRADHLSCYGYPRKTTPNIDQLAKDGLLFTNAFSNSSWTLPAHLSMLTGLYSLSHGVITGSYALDPSRTTLAEILQSHGYATAGFVSAPYVDSLYGFDQGFDLYDDSLNGQSKSEKRHGHRAITSPLLNKAILSWLKENYQKQFFLFLHYFDVHYDYVAPDPFRTMFDRDYTGSLDGRNFTANRNIHEGMDIRDLAHLIALYDAEIAFTDSHVGQIITALKQYRIYDKTLIILTSDHGEEFFEHGRKGHRHSLYDEVLQVPLIFKFPVSAKHTGQTSDLASLVDIMPTALSSVGLTAPEESQGTNLLTGKNEAVYARLENKIIAVRSARHKLIKHLKRIEHEFYDLGNDPAESNNLLKFRSIVDAPRATEHLALLLNWLHLQRSVSQKLPKSKRDEKIKLDENMQEQLKALGYIQ